MLPCMPMRVTWSSLHSSTWIGGGPWMICTASSPRVDLVIRACLHWKPLRFVLCTRKMILSINLFYSWSIKWWPLANAILQHITDDEHRDSEEVKSSLVSISVSKRKCSACITASDLKSKWRSTADIPSGSLGHSSAVSQLSGAVVLRSAFRPPTKQPKWMRNPDMLQYSFTYSTAIFTTSGSVVFSSMEPANIEIAKDWSKGERLYDQGKEHEATGFIGKGYTKLGIYVCSSFSKCNEKQVYLSFRHGSRANSVH